MDGGLVSGGVMALQAIGGAVGAAGTLMGGSYARQAGQMQQAEDDYQAAQLERDSGTAIGVAQEKMLDRRFSTNMLLSKLRANAAGGGVAVASPTVAEDAGAIASRGRFASLLDLWQGQNQATGMLKQAAGLRYSGDIAELAGEQSAEASKFAAVATLMNAGAGMGKTYAALNWPTSSGAAVPNLRASYG